ncbi:MAG: hypothetical protein GF350_13245 [Chitinivibrionales bacterium]|nr:hypothetical protein [Chitinivibrionales bacterium]
MQFIININMIRYVSRNHILFIFPLLLLWNGPLSLIVAHETFHSGKTNAIIESHFVQKNYSYGGVGEVHSATIAQASNGTLVCAFYGGTEEGENDVGIYVSRFNGSSWSTPERIDNINGSGPVCWNPVIFQPKRSGAPLLLWYKVTGSPTSGWAGVIRTSTDAGQSWSVRTDLPSTSNSYYSAFGAQYIGPTKDKPLEMPDGSLLLGSSWEIGGSDYRIHIEKQDNSDYTQGYSLFWGPYSSGYTARMDGYIQPAFLWHSADKQQLQMVVRRGVGKETHTSFSDDGGKTWGPFSVLTASGTRGAVQAGIDAQTLDNGWHVVAGSQGGTRDRGIAVVISQDGISWQQALRLDDQDPPQGQAGHRTEYPSMILDNQNKLQLVYTAGDHVPGSTGRGRNKKNILHVVLDPDVLTGGTTSSGSRTAMTAGMQSRFAAWSSGAAMTIDLPAAGRYLLTMNTLQGKCIALRADVSGRVKVPVSNLPSGAYFIRISGNNRNYLYRFAVK